MFSQLKYRFLQETINFSCDVYKLEGDMHIILEIMYLNGKNMNLEHKIYIAIMFSFLLECIQLIGKNHRILIFSRACSS